MKLKCKYCDDKNEKSIDTSTNKYVKINVGYAHSDCHRMYLITRKKLPMKEEDAILEILRLEEITKKENEENELRAKFYNMLVEYYKIPIPNNFFIKIDAITKGKYKGISNSISYFELYEMYSNKKMLQKLESIACSKNIIDMEDRYHWDFGVMVNEYPKYVKAKLKNKALQNEANNAIENIEKYRIDKTDRYINEREKTKEENENSTKVDDIVNDLFGI